MTGYAFPNARILLLVKAPVPGRVKTRLAPLLGAQGAADYLAAELRRLARSLHESALAPVEVWAGVDASHEIFQELHATYGWRVRAQPEGDLGARMRHAARRGLLEADSVLLVGADCPQMGPEYLRMALEALQARCAAVIGPAQDGGYVLLGLRQVKRELFADIEWSTPGVLAKTRERLRGLGWLWQELPTLRDVDTPEDYLHFHPH